MEGISVHLDTKHSLALQSITILELYPWTEENELNSSRSKHFETDHPSNYLVVVTKLVVKTGEAAPSADAHARQLESAWSSDYGEPTPPFVSFLEAKRRLGLNSSMWGK